MASDITQKSEVIIYITRDIERALGRLPVGNYFIVTNKTPYSEKIKEQFDGNIFLINSEKILDTYELLILPEVRELISKYDSKIVVFKNTLLIEKYCNENNILLLNPSAELSEKVENKITQVFWLEKLSSFLPSHKVLLTRDIPWENKVFVLQWSHGHTGESTILVQNEKILSDLKEKFPDREARVTDYIKGPMFTLNVVVASNMISYVNISYQITGILPFTENIFSTIGNDWSLPHTILTDNHIKKIKDIADQVGVKMRSSGWKGLFGIDVIYDEERDEIHLIEINARQPASTTFESELQSKTRLLGVAGLTTFEAHIFALTTNIIPTKVIEINDGAQIVQRITSQKTQVDENKLKDIGYKVIKYTNTKLNLDLLRIQSTLGIMETHTKFNKRGKQIIDLLL